MCRALDPRNVAEKNINQREPGFRVIINQPIHSNISPRNNILQELKDYFRIVFDLKGPFSFLL